MAAMQQALIFGGTSGIGQWDSSTKGNALVLSNSNLTATRSLQSNGNGNGGVVGDKAISSGKFYFEVSLDVFNPNGITGANASPQVAIIPFSLISPLVSLGTFGTFSTFNVSKRAYYSRDGTINYGGTSTTSTALNVGDRWCVAVDVNLKTVWFGRNGVWIGNPSAGTGGFTVAGFDGPLYPAIATWNTTNSPDTVTLRSTISSMSYTIPSGFSAYA